MRRWILLCVVLAALLVPAPAFALRYASPTGSGVADCDTVATACSLETAIEGLGPNVPVAGEEVVVLPGTYTQATEVVQTVSNLDVHGDYGQPRPVINQTARITFFSGKLSYLTLQGVTASELLNFSGGTAERLFIRGSSVGGSPACQCYGGLLRDSVVVSTTATPALGLTTNGGTATMTYRNVTAYVSDPAAAVLAVRQVGVPDTVSFTAYNLVALHGGGGTEVLADGPDVTITFARSNYRSVSAVDAGVIQDAPGDPHQTAPPQFANPAAADFTPLATSPTVDAGLTDALNGPLDLAGNPRTIGAATDIGALEFKPPASGSAKKKCKKAKKKKKKKKKRKSCKKKKKKKKKKKRG